MTARCIPRFAMAPALAIVLVARDTPAQRVVAAPHRLQQIADGSAAPRVAQSMAPEIARITGLPVRVFRTLPSVWPLPADTHIEATFDATHYVIEFAGDFGCDLRNVCTFGAIEADRGRVLPTGIAVRLAHGIDGRYVASQCSAYCTRPMISWSQDGVRYRVSPKGLSVPAPQEREAVIAIANSVIDGVVVRGSR